MKLSKRLDLFPEYIFSTLGRKKREIEQKTGKKVLDLSMGSPDYPPSKIYTDKLKEFVTADSAHMYAGFGANENFSKALVDWYKKRFGVTLKENELLPLLGGKDGVSHLPLALIDEGDEVLIPDPGYPGFTGPALMFGAKCVYYDLSARNGFKINIIELERRITKKTKYFWVNFPSNPTGQVATVEDLKPLIKIAKKHNIILVYDNAYAEITFEHFVAPSILEVPGAHDVAVEIGSFSKSHSFAGYRMGWIVGNSQVIAALAKVKSQLDSGMWTPLQNLAAFALTNPDEKWERMMIRSYLDRRNIIAKKFQQLGCEVTLPKGGIYIWAKIPKNETDSEKYCFKLLEDRQILVAPGTAFGNNGKEYIRLCIASNIEHINDYI